MNGRYALFGIFILCAAVAMAAPAPAPGADWVDRMAALRAATPQVSADWVDRMAAAYAEREFQLALGADPRGSEDWVDRLVADRGGDFARGLGIPLSGVQAALAR